MAELYNSFHNFLTEKFQGLDIRKIPINAGFKCPNKDGSISSRGCIFCDTYGSGPIEIFSLPIKDQIEKIMAAHSQYHYLAYFQAHSNTYGPVDVLRKKYETIFNYQKILGLFIGTRPDAIAEEVYPLLGELSKRTYLTIELGLQSIHPQSLEYLERNHTYDTFLDTFHKLKEEWGIDVVVHLILGIPGEDKSHIRQTIAEMNRIKPRGVKLHLFHVLKDTPLFHQYTRGEIKLFEQEEYIDLIVFVLEQLDPDIVIHRLTGERDCEIFHAPLWSMDKLTVINLIRNKMKKLRTYQGRLFTPAP